MKRHNFKILDALNFIHEINTQNDCLKIKVRIVRIWKQSFSLDMILIDEKGKKIQGTIKAKLIHNFERFLAEGSIVVLSNFGVAENSGNYRIINHPCKLNFYHTTTVKKIEVFDGPVYGFGFVKFHDINNKKIGDEFAIDVIGGVVSCGNMDVYDRNGKEGKRINFEMQDLEGKVVNCTLWDNFTQELSTFVNANKNDGCVIIIIQFARVRLWKGIPTIQNGLFGSKLFINDNLKDIIDFKKKSYSIRLISKSGDSSSQQFSQLSCQTIYSRNILRSTTPCSEEKLFGGKVVVFGGSRHDIVNSSLNSSYIWDHCTVLKLTINMRLQVGAQNDDSDQTKQFADWILKIGNGTLGEPNDGQAMIEISGDLLINETCDPVSSFISFTYLNIFDNVSDSSYFQDRAILAPTHEVVDTINEHMLLMMPTEETVYFSSDSICESEERTTFDRSLFSPEYLNSLRFSGVPNHKLALKVGVPIMLLRNIDQTNGLCNGTRLQVEKLGKHVIQAKIITGTNAGMITLIPRMNLTPSDKRILFKIKRKQFPVCVCFAMTINKSQGQSLSRVGLFLPRPVFTHGQLYVAISRVKSKDGLKVLICDANGKTMSTTTNVVYKEVLQKMCILSKWRATRVFLGFSFMPNRAEWVGEPMRKPAVKPTQGCNTTQANHITCPIDQNSKHPNPK
ncbi:hypothetical protein OSB04_015479 [Centaurea solstitialis]|uniref:ATP-dependent DNA helicase n=1 Tax=Centaurea solstitialis TaxID=347529 RepID=A0AA38WIT2_9ASTR|nr:hypothetical protein OSB04_015479 [Centaurea solstitialis]